MASVNKVLSLMVIMVVAMAIVSPSTVHGGKKRKHCIYFLPEILDLTRLFFNRYYF
jgi:hypothetical protein